MNRTKNILKWRNEEAIDEIVARVIPQQMTNPKPIHNTQ